MTAFSFTSIIGALAALASTTSFAPQAWRIIRRRRTEDLSVAACGLTVSGFALWLCYGLLSGGWPLIVANGICLLLSSFILMMRLLPKDKKAAVADVLSPAIDSIEPDGDDDRADA